MSLEASLLKNAFTLIQNAKNLPGELNQVTKLLIEEAKVARHVIWAGVGKCFTIATKAMESGCSLGIPSFALDCMAALHGDLGMVVNNQLIIFLSKSGETEEILKCMEGAAKKGARLISISCKNDSTAGKIAKTHNGFDIVLNCEQECDELNLAPTSSTILFASITDALIIEASKTIGLTKEQFLENHVSGSLGKKLKKEINAPKK